MKTNFGLRIVCLAFWLNATVWVCAESPPDPLRVSFKDEFVSLINGTPADTSDLGRAVEMIEDKTKVVQVYRESQRPFPSSSLSTIFRRGLGVQFAFKPNFSDITVNTPAMRVHEEPNVEGEKIDFTGFISDVCPVHREKMKITKVQWLREFDPKLIPTISREKCNKQFPFPGAAIAGVYFKGTADVYECPTCSRGFEALVKKTAGPPKIVGKWSTYPSIRGVPKDLMDAFMTLDETSIADAGEDFAFTCMATPYEARRRFGVAPDAKLVVSVSRLVPRKGMDVLIEASARLTGAHPTLEVVIGGSGRDAKRLQRLIDETGAPARLLGRVDDEHLPALYGTADVFSMACRNRWLGLEQEGFGIVFLEAAACAVPQIAGQSGGSAEAVEHDETGLVIEDPSSAEELATALDALLTDPDRRAAMGAAGRARAVDEFSYDVLAARLQDALSRTCSS